MSKRSLAAAVAVVLGAASQAQAFHPLHCGQSYYHLRMHGPAPAPFFPSGGGFGTSSSFGSFGATPSFGYGFAPMPSFGFSTMPSSSFGFGFTPNTGSNGTAFGASFLDVLSILQRAFNVNPGGGGTTVDLSPIKRDLETIKSNQEKMMEDLRQLKIKLGVAQAPLNGTPKPDIAPPGGSGAPAFAAVDRQLTDLAASRRALDADRAAASAKTPAVTRVAGGR